jgi:hypothetical protein
MRQVDADAAAAKAAPAGAEVGRIPKDAAISAGGSGPVVPSTPRTMYAEDIDQNRYREEDKYREEVNKAYMAGKILRRSQRL